MVLTKLIKCGLAIGVRLSMKGLRRGPHVTRYYMYRRLSELKRSPFHEARVLAISHSTHLCKILGLDSCQIVEANYPEYNMLSLPFSDNSFNYVVSDQILEHIEGTPQAAMNETHRVLKSGGLAIHTTCFIYPIHGAPSDFWRFTPESLRLLCKEFSRIIECEGWGNLYVWILGWLGLRWDGVPHCKWHPLHKIAMYNDPKWPIVTWIIAEK
jgi:ubiquinone/menaquinone biosynthesis C-methylase UbiE